MKGKSEYKPSNTDRRTIEGDNRKAVTPNSCETRSLGKNLRIAQTIARLLSIKKKVGTNLTFVPPVKVIISE